MRIALVASLIALAGCTEEPTPVEAEKALEQTIAADGAAEAKAEAATIEEAADAAAKLVEEEAQEEIDGYKGEAEQTR